MTRVFPLIAGMIVVVGTGLAHGVWTERWRQAPELSAAVKRLERFPETIGPWKSKPAPEDTEAFEKAGAAGWRVRQFTDPRRGSFLVILMCGRAGPMSVHRPEHCYRGEGFDMISPSVTAEVPAAGDIPAATYWTSRFSREEEMQTARLRISWTWFDGRTWQAPTSPRMTFARLPALYKLYVIRELTDTNEEREEALAKDFIARLLPELSKALSPP
jgi:hypothetical protein